MRRSAAALCLVALLFGAACHKPQHLSGRSKQFGSGLLETQFRRDRSGDEFALVHILFVAERRRPGTDYSWRTSNGGTVDLYEFKHEYVEDGGRTVIKPPPVIVREDETVEVPGHTYPLARGNVFVARIAHDGAIRLTQLPIVERDRSTSAEAVMERIRAAVPGVP